MLELNIGIFGDLHLYKERGNHHKQIAEALKRHNLRAIVFLGDSASNMRTDEGAQVEEISEALATFDGIGVPIYWMPGNSESFVAHRTAFRNVSPQNITDASSLNQAVNLDGYDLVFVPGTSYESRGFRVADPEGQPTGDYGDYHVFNLGDLESLVKKPDKTILFAHNPCHIAGDHSIDLTKGTRHRGNKVLTPILRRLGNKYFFSGDIHDAAHDGKGIVDLDGTPIQEGKYVPGLYATPGAAKEGYYAITKFRHDGTASINRFNVQRTE